MVDQPAVYARMNSRRAGLSRVCAAIVALFVVGVSAAGGVLAGERVGTGTAGGLKVDDRRWGMLAADMKGHIGFSVGYYDRDYAKAEADAVRGCGAPGCAVIMRERSYCIGFADSHNNGYWFGKSIAATKEQAGSLALGFCNQAPGAAGTCKVQVAACQ